MPRCCAPLLALAVFACRSTPAVPTEDEARRAVEPELWRFGETVDFGGLGGETVEKPAAYRLRFRAAVRLTEACYWRKLVTPRKIEGRSVEAELKRAEDLTPEELTLVDRGGFLPPHITALPAGALYVIEGVVRFRRSEAGWVFDSWTAGRRGHCIEGTPADCYTAHRLGA